MPIPSGFWVKPAPDIRSYPHPPYFGSWVCKKCGGIDVCYCLDQVEGDPICDCGWPAYACKCNDEDSWIKE